MPLARRGLAAVAVAGLAVIPSPSGESMPAEATSVGTTTTIPETTPEPPPSPEAVDLDITDQLKEHGLELFGYPPELYPDGTIALALENGCGGVFYQNPGPDGAVAVSAALFGRVSDLSDPDAVNAVDHTEFGFVHGDVDDTELPVFYEYEPDQPGTITVLARDLGAKVVDVCDRFVAEQEAA